jgi:hypothetical protein
MRCGRCCKRRRQNERRERNEAYYKQDNCWTCLVLYFGGNPYLVGFPHIQHCQYRKWESKLRTLPKNERNHESRQADASQKGEARQIHFHAVIAAGICGDSRRNQIFRHGEN